MKHRPNTPNSAGLAHREFRKKSAGFTHTNSKRSLGGFTIIELIFATLIFSMVMMVILVSVFQVARIYYKGVSISNTNEVARTTVEDIANDVRFANTADTTNINKTPTGWFCVGLHRYSFVKFVKVTNASINNKQSTGIRQDVVNSGCPNPNTPTSGKDARQLLGPDMQLNNLVFNCANGACTVGVHIIFYGADNLVFKSSAHPNTPSAALKDPDATCSGNLLSSQFCAAVDLQTKVLQRL